MWWPLLLLLLVLLLTEYLATPWAFSFLAFLLGACFPVDLPHDV
ncbi:unnamed protein product, partial [Amoebophrya sp. A25]|eukprot:GSA25T00024031001.1